MAQKWFKITLMRCLYFQMKVQLVISKLIKLKTGLSIRRYLDESKKIVDREILNHITRKTLTVQAEPTDKMNGITSMLNAPR